MFRSTKLVTAIILLLSLTLLLSACSGTSNTNEVNGVSETTVNNAPVEDDNNSDISGETVVQHKYGETTIPTNPSRIVSIGLEDMLLSLDLPLVYATLHGEQHYLEEKLKENNVEIGVQLGDQFNYEAILAANPDLIMMIAGYSETIYDELSKIAPTILLDRENWHEEIVRLGELLKIEEKANALLEANENQILQAKEAIVSEVGEDATVAFLRIRDKMAYLWFTFPSDSKNKGYVGLIYDSLGLQPDPLITKLMEENPDQQWGVNLSLEKLPEITADYIFITAGSSGGAASDNDAALNELTEIEKLQVWQGLPAVQNDNVFKVSAKHWMLAGPLADEMKVNDVVQALTAN